MTTAYESHVDIPVRKITPLEELQDAATMLEPARGELDMSRDRYSKAVSRWNDAAGAAAEWITAHSPEAQNAQIVQKAAY